MRTLKISLIVIVLVSLLAACGPVATVEPTEEQVQPTE